jgi:hypothetical protein
VLVKGSAAAAAAAVVLTAYSMLEIDKTDTLMTEVSNTLLDRMAALLLTLTTHHKTTHLLSSTSSPW